MRLFDIPVSSPETDAQPTTVREAIALIMRNSPLTIEDFALLAELDASDVQAYLETGATGGIANMEQRIAKAARFDEAGVPRGPYCFTPMTQGEANAVWLVTRASEDAPGFAFEVVAGDPPGAGPRSHHIFAYGDKGGHTSLLYVPRHGTTDIWPVTQAISVSNFDLLHSMVSDVISSPAGQVHLLEVLGDWLHAAIQAWSAAHPSTKPAS